MGHPDQHTPDDHRSSEKKAAPEPEIDENVAEDLDADAGSDLDEKTHGSGSVRTDEPDEGRPGEYGHTYMGRQMDDELKKTSRPRDEDELTE